MEFSVIQKIAIFALPVIFAITLHEAAHGYAAKYFGDLTADRAGRISLNPIRHISLVGTVLVPALILLTSKLLGAGFILFGWAKPVPVDFTKLGHPKHDMLWVALAGPASNFVMAIFWALVIRFGTLLGPLGNLIVLMGVAGVFINTVLMTLNLLPLPPLDGGRIAVSILPQPYASMYARIEPFGLVILIVLLYARVLDVILLPMLTSMMAIIVGLVGISYPQYSLILNNLLR